MNRLLVCIAVGMLVFFSACTTNKKDVSQGSEKKDVVLILNDIPNNCKVYTPRYKKGYTECSYLYEIGYNVKSIITTEFRPDYTRDKDTIVIKSVANPIEIHHRYRGLEMFNYLAQPGDTLYFSYEGEMPIVRNSRKSKQYDYNYDVLLRKKIYGDEYSSFANLIMPFLLFEDFEKYRPLKNKYRSEAMDRDMKLFRVKNYFKGVFQLDEEEKILDTLIANNHISKNLSEFYKQRIKYKRMSLKIRSNRDATFKGFQQTDSLLKYSFYRDVIDLTSEHGIARKIRFRKPRNHYNYNSEEVYDAIQKAPYLSYGTRKYLSYKWFKIITESSMPDTVREYFELFKSEYGNDTILINSLIKDCKLLTQ